MQLKDEAGRTQHQDEQEVEERAQQRAHEVRGLTVAGHAHAAAALAVVLVRVQLSQQHRARSVTRCAQTRLNGNTCSPAHSRK